MYTAGTGICAGHCNLDMDSSVQCPRWLRFGVLLNAPLLQCGAHDFNWKGNKCYHNSKLAFPVLVGATTI